ncbi:MAG: ABC transporter substrate-binding protein [Chloroflexi bacterium]|nr:MAG: ABC transporter substrate-binding protein [Chloroflexota bacterium]
MKQNTLRRLLIFTTLLLIAATGMTVVSAQDGAWPRTVVDGLGNAVTIDAPPQRIVTTSLGADEVLLSLLPPDRFASVTALAQDPGISNVAVQANQVENALPAADAEFIISLDPDLVFVASFTDEAIVQQLRDAGLTVFTTGFPIGFDPIREAVLQIGEVVGEEAGAAALIAQMDADIAAVEEAVANIPEEERTRVLYLTPGNFTSGLNSSIAQAIEAGGGIDVTVAAGIDQLVPVSDEFIIEQDPDVILLSGWTPFDPTFLDTFFGNPAFAELSAIQNNRVFIANDAHLTTVSHFISEGVKDVAAYLYPDVFPAYPLTLTDAAGDEIVIESKPLFVRGATAEADTLIELLRPHLPEDSATEFIFSTDLVYDAPIDVQLSTDDLIGVFRLYDDDSPAARVANLQLIGDVLGERAAAQTAIALLTDELEALAAQ